MDRIRDLGYYHKVVPSGPFSSFFFLLQYINLNILFAVKSIVTYNETKYEHVRQLMIGEFDLLLQWRLKLGNSPHRGAVQCWNIYFDFLVFCGLDF